MHAHPMHCANGPAARRVLSSSLDGAAAVLQASPDGSNEAGAEEIPALTTTDGIAADIKSGYTLHVHNGDLAYAECATPHCQPVTEYPAHCRGLCTTSCQVRQIPAARDTV